MSTSRDSFQAARNRGTSSSRSERQESTSRGALNSSSKFNSLADAPPLSGSGPPKGPAALRDTSNVPHQWRKRNAKLTRSFNQISGADHQPDSNANGYEREQADHAAKRTRRNENFTHGRKDGQDEREERVKPHQQSFRGGRGRRDRNNSRGGGGGGRRNSRAKSLRPEDSSEASSEKAGSSDRLAGVNNNRPQSQALVPNWTSNSTTTMENSNPFGSVPTGSASSNNPFAPASTPAKGIPQPQNNMSSASAFGAPSQPQTNTWGNSSSPVPETTVPSTNFNPFAQGLPQGAGTVRSSAYAKPSYNPFSAAPASNGFANITKPLSTFTPASSNTFGAQATVNSNANAPGPSLFGKTSQNPFAASPFANGSYSSPAPSMFGKPYNGSPSTHSETNGIKSHASSSTPFGKPANTNGTPTISFGAQNTPKTNPFETSGSTSVFGANSFSKSSNGVTGVFGTINQSKKTSEPPTIKKTTPFGQASSPLPTFGSHTTIQNSSGNNNRLKVATPATSKPRQITQPPAKVGSPSIKRNGSLNRNKSESSSTNKNMPTPLMPKVLETSDSLNNKIDQVLSRKRIQRPPWPAVNFQENKPIWESYTTQLRDFRTKARPALTQAGLIDDPDVPKRLEDAIVFKGTCDDMCPRLEAAERIVERRFDSYEKDILDDGSLSTFVSPDRMIKKLARSAAGQEAPLPEDVRTVTALKNTMDYLIDELLGTFDLQSVHSFIWDRTRAIRRDFVFHSYMTSEELVDRVYVLENITRFHVVALHQMSKKGINSVDFVEQQEQEQLGKTLISLMHAYEDCNAQGIKSENEAEFRAYQLLFNRRDPSMLQRAQDWGWEFWGDTAVIKTAVRLVEACQTIWDAHGPLQNPTTRGNTEFDIALGAFAGFFTLVADPSVSYTMACFAEICFNDVRKAIMKTILKAYRRQKDQTKDWTLFKLNIYLQFDEEADIVPWGEKHGLHFDVNGNDEEYLSFEQSSLHDASPEVPQRYSQSLVEYKRGNRSLQEVIRTTVYDEEEPIEVDCYIGVNDEEEESLFVNDDSVAATPVHESSASLENRPELTEKALESNVDLNNAALKSVDQTPPSSAPPPASIFDRIEAPKPFGTDFFSMPPQQSPAQKETSAPKSSEIVENEVKSIFAQSMQAPSASQGSPSFSFLLQGQVEDPRSSANQLFATPASVSAPGQQLSPTLPPTMQMLGNTQSQPRIPIPSPQSQSQPTLLPTGPEPREVNAAVSNSSIDGPSISNPAHAMNLPTSTPTFTNSAVVQSQPSSVHSAPEGPRRIDKITDWFVLADGGVVDDFVESHLESFLVGAFQQHTQETQEAANRAAAEALREEAYRHRHFHLATKYLAYWRRAVQKIRWKKRAAGRGERRRAFAESKRKMDIVEEFRQSTTMKHKKEIARAQEAAELAKSQASARSQHRQTRERRESLDSLLHSTDVSNPVERLRATARGGMRTRSEPGTPPLDKGEKSTPSNKRSRMDDSSLSGSAHKRVRSNDYKNPDHPIWRTMLSDPSYTMEGSRIQFMPDWNSKVEDDLRPVSGVQSDYWRLKARGITTMPDGRPIASTIAMQPVRHKRSFDKISRPSTPQSSVREWARSLQPKSVPSARPRVPSFSSNSNAAVDRASPGSSFGSVDKSPSQCELEDEELFARCRKVKKQMEEGIAFYRGEAREILDRISPDEEGRSRKKRKSSE